LIWGILDNICITPIFSVGGMDMDTVRSFINTLDSVWGGIIILILGILVFFIPIILQWVVGIILIYVGIKTITRKKQE